MQLLALRLLVVNKIHLPHVVRPDGHGAVNCKFGLYPPFRRLMTELHAQFLVHAIDYPDVHALDFAVEQDVNASTTILVLRFTDLPDPRRHGTLIGEAGFVVERRAVKAVGPTNLSN